MGVPGCQLGQFGTIKAQYTSGYQSVSGQLIHFRNRSKLNGGMKLSLINILLHAKDISWFLTQRVGNFSQKTWKKNFENVSIYLYIFYLHHFSTILHIPQKALRKRHRVSHWYEQFYHSAALISTRTSFLIPQFFPQTWSEQKFYKQKARKTDKTKKFKFQFFFQIFFNDWNFF